MVAIYKEALSHLWLMFEPNFEGFSMTNQMTLCSNATSKLQNGCLFSENKFEYMSLIETTADGLTIETLFGSGTEYVEIIANNILYILNKIRLLFYLVWPTEIMFSSLGQVPRYVAEVSIHKRESQTTN